MLGLTGWSLGQKMAFKDFDNVDNETIEYENDEEIWRLEKVVHMLTVHRILHLLALPDVCAVLQVHSLLSNNSQQQQTGFWNLMKTPKQAELNQTPSPMFSLKN